jgi:hypothetical protein
MSAQLQSALAEKPAGRVILDEAPEVYYQRDPCVANATGLKIIHSRTPKHFYHWATHPDFDKRTKALEFGRALHSATLEPDAFEHTYIVLPEDAPDKPTERMLNATGKRTPNSQFRIDWWADFRARTVGKIELSAEDFDRVRYMGESMRSTPEAAGLLVGGHREATLRWVDEETGVACKARVDNFDPGERWMMDLKGCVDAGEPFARASAGYGYDLAAAHYVDGADACGVPVDYFILLACESEAPYDCVPYYFGPKEQERGRAIRQRAIRQQAECLRTGIWPGRARGLTELTYPTWAFYGIEEMQ